MGGKSVQFSLHEGKPFINMGPTTPHSPSILYTVVRLLFCQGVTLYKLGAHIVVVEERVDLVEPMQFSHILIISFCEHGGSSSRGPYKVALSFLFGS